MVKEVPLSKGKVSLVDDEDYESAMQYKWYANFQRDRWYARKSTPEKNGKRQAILLHRIIINPPNNMEVDHINGDGLDNRRCNLRIVTHSQNMMNQRKTRGTSKYKGVSWAEDKHKWGSQIIIHPRPNRKNLCLGYFEKEVDAAHAYDEAAKKYFGEYAKLNFPKGLKENKNNG